MRSAWLVVLWASISLAGPPRAKPKPPPPAPAADPNATTLYEYDDGTGMQQVESLQDVPAKYRAKAHAVTATPIDSAPVAPPQSTDAPARGEGARGGAGSQTPGGLNPPRYYCTWQGSFRATAKFCSSDADCGKDKCAHGTCVERGTIEGKRWHGCYSGSGDLQAVKRACENDGYASASEVVTCTCSTDPATVASGCK